MDNILKEVTTRMEKAIEAFQHELAKLRTGRASLSILDGIQVECYGQQSPLNQVSSLSTPDPRTIAIQPWDTSVIPAIEKAIQTSGLGLTPSNDGKIIRIAIPALNEERRRELVKMVKRHAEECKVSVRNARRDGNEKLKDLKKEGNLTEDEERKGQDQTQKLTDEFSKKVDDMVVRKEKDIMEV